MSATRIYLSLCILSLCLSLAWSQNCYDNTDGTYQTNTSSFEIEYEVTPDSNQTDDNSTEDNSTAILICYCPDGSIPNQIDYSCDCEGNNINFNGEGCFCDPGYTLVGGSCINCQYPCQSCSAENQCSQCAEGHYLDDTSCIAAPIDLQGILVRDDGQTYECPGACTDCSNNFPSCNTDSCADGYYQQSGQCINCEQNCLACDSNGCSDCFSGFYLDSTSCVECEDNNCLDCTDSECSSCVSGYYALGNACEPCSDSCKVCESQSICTSCNLGYSLYNNECFECIQGCTWCSVTELSQCLGCSKGYYLNTNQKCTVCPTGCQTCTSAKSCSACQEGYKLSGNSCVQSCAFPCKECLTNRPTSCTYCYGGYTLNSRKCNANLSCSGSCDSCPRQYYLKDGTCLSCGISNCISCRQISANNTQCTRCRTGYTLNSSENACTSCPSECETCTSMHFCTTCASGYFLDKKDGQSTGKCIECSNDYHCATCSLESHICSSCDAGYILMQNKCISKYYLDFAYRLDLSPTQFYSKANVFKNAILNKADISNSSRSRVTISSITQGSTVIDGSVNADSAYQMNSMEQSFTTNDDLEDPNLPVISSTFTGVVIEEEQVTEEELSMPVKTGLIVGLTIFGASIIILVVVALIRSRKQSREQKYEVPYNASNDELKKRKNEEFAMAE